MTEETLTIKQAARELGIDEKTVRRWIKGGQLEAEINIVGRYSIKRSVFDAFVEERRKRIQDKQG